MTTELKPCGTPAAYARHIARGEPIDDPCREAHTADAADRRRGRAVIKRRERLAHGQAVEALIHRYPMHFAALYEAALREEEASDDR